MKGQLKSIGIDPERVEMYNLSAADGPLFVEYAKKYTERITDLGPVYQKGEIKNEAG